MQAPVLLLIAALAQVDLSFIPAPTSRLLHFHSSAPFFTDALRYKPVHNYVMDAPSFFINL